MTIRDELLTVQSRSKDGMLHVEEAYQWAVAHPKSDLHQALEWDDQKAALQYRFDQIRHLIRVHVVTPDFKPVLISLSPDRVQGGGYRRVADVVANRKLSDVMLMDALAELERVQTKYEWIVELTDVWEQVKAARLRHPRPEAEKRRHV